MKGHAKPLKQENLNRSCPERRSAASTAADAAEATRPCAGRMDEHAATFEDQLALPALPVEQREVTAILVRTSSILVVPPAAEQHQRRQSGAGRAAGPRDLHAV